MAVVCAQAQQVAYTINGVSSNNGAKVALFDMQAGKLLTTAEVVNGKFSLTGNAEKDLMMAIQLENNGWITSVINDGTPMTVNLNDSTLKGSAQNERMVNYDLKMNANFNEEKAAPILEEIFTKEANTMIPMAFVGQYLQVFGLDKMGASTMARKTSFFLPLYSACTTFAARFNEFGVLPGKSGG